MVLVGRLGDLINHHDPTGALNMYLGGPGRFGYKETLGVPLSEEEIFLKFRKVRTLGYLLRISACLFLVVEICQLHIWTAIIGICIYAFLSFAFYRCPMCRRRPGDGSKANYCQSCGVQLRQTET